MFQSPLRRLWKSGEAQVGEEIGEEGFTLIELMVVLLIIAILLAIAIPGFLGVTNTAGDHAAQSNVSNALTESKALYEVNQAYSQNGASYTSGQFQAQAPEFTWQTTACSASATNCICFMVLDGNGDRKCGLYRRGLLRQVADGHLGVRCQYGSVDSQQGFLGNQLRERWNRQLS